MADKKISALTAATTPLVGTEVLPIVQGGATVKVPNNDLRPKQIQSNATSGVLQVAGPGAAATRVMTTPDANFSAARIDAAQSFVGDQTLSTGNLIMGTADKGIDFSINSAAAGATSELFNDYEIGTWTPVYQTTGTAFTSVTYAIQIGHYTKVGRQVTVSARLRTSALVAGLASGEVVISGLPYAPATSLSAATGVVSGASGFLGDVPLSGVTQANFLYLYYRTAANGIDNALAPADMGAGASANDIFITVTYFV